MSTLRELAMGPVSGAFGLRFDVFELDPEGRCIHLSLHITVVPWP